MKNIALNLNSMNQAFVKNRSLKPVFRSIMLSLSAFTLVACSSGGGGSETSTSSIPSTSNYIPNAERLLEEATNSNELYVEPDFRFDQTNTTQLNITATDDTGQALPYTRINIYIIDTSQMAEPLTEWSDEYTSKAHLIAGGQSNREGEFVRVIEFPTSQSSTPLLLIEVNAIGFENKAIVPVQSERTEITLGAA